MLKRAIQKYGISAFTKEILQEFQTEADMVQVEAQLVNEYLVARKDTYNIVIGGKGGFSYINRTGLSVRNITKRNAKQLSKKANETKKELIRTDPIFRERMQKIWNTNRQTMLQRVANNGPPFLGKKHTTKTKRKISLAKKGKTTGENNSQYGTMWITNGSRNSKILKNDLIPEGWYRGRIILDSQGIV